MFDFYANDLSNMRSIQFSVFSKLGEKPFEQLDLKKYDVFLITNSVHYSYQESQQLLKKVDLIPATLLVMKVLHYLPLIDHTSGVSFFDGAKEGKSQVLSSSLFLVAEKSSVNVALPAFKELGFLIEHIRAAKLSNVAVLQPLDINSLTY